MGCVTRQEAILASLADCLEAEGLSVVVVGRSNLALCLSCPGRANTQCHRRRSERAALIWLGGQSEAEAARAAIAKSGLGSLLRPERQPSSHEGAASCSTHEARGDSTGMLLGDEPPCAAGASPGIPRHPVTNRGPLSTREAEVLRLFANGALASQVAQQLYVSPKTVKNHLSSIYRKLGAANRTQAVALAVKQGIIAMGDASH